jgi:hypothetical protein
MLVFWDIRDRLSAFAHQLFGSQPERRRRDLK